MNSIQRCVVELIKSDFLPFVWNANPELPKTLTLEAVVCLVDKWAPGKNEIEPRKTKPIRSKSDVAPPLIVKDASFVEQPKLTIEEYNKMKRTELKDICKKLRLPVSGTKQALIDTILDHFRGDSVVKPVPRKSLKLEKSTIIVKRDNSGHLVEETGLIFDDDIVIGFKNEAGQTLALNSKQMDYCKERNIPFAIPETFEVVDDEAANEIDLN